MKRLNKFVLITGLVVTFFMAGCDGDGNTTPEASNPPPSSGPGTVPNSAGASVSAFLDFIQSLASSDTSEPLTIGDGFETPTDDTGEPRPLT